MEILIVLSTFGDAEVAATVACTLVDERLCACVNLVDGVRSIYRWNGALADEREVLAIAKTTAARKDALVARLTALHPYEVPEIVILAGDAAAPYLRWVAAETA